MVYRTKEILNLKFKKGPKPLTIGIRMDYKSSDGFQMRQEPSIANLQVFFYAISFQCYK
jgi:hypothetical protein